MTEEWRDVQGWGGIYQVSNLGRVRTFSRKYPAGHILSPSLSRGYLRVSFRIEGRRESRFVHGLVAEAFIGPRPEGLEVCHKDGTKTNNRPDNLRYDTHSANVRDMVSDGAHHFASKTKCPEGHPYDEANTYRRSTGARGCRECRNAACRRYTQRKAA